MSGYRLPAESEAEHHAAMTLPKPVDIDVESPALKVVLAHWQAVRGNRLMPAWRDIDPAAIGRHLPMVWAWRYDVDQATFIGRLAGEEILAVLGKEIRGRRLEQCFPADAAGVVLERYKTVIRTPSILHSTGHVHMKTGRHGVGERLVLPLADDGITGDGILGVTEYRLSIADAKSVGAAIDHHHEDIAFHPLA